MTADLPLTRLLHEEAAARGLRDPAAPLPSVPEAFALVRDLPYARASTHDPAGIVREWRGTCSTKHELLAALLAERGVPSTVVACTQEITPPPGAPPELLALSGNRPVVDVHNYLIVHAPQGDMVVDATWPLGAAGTGLPVNPDWVWGQDQALACTPLETWPVPAGESVADFKGRVLRERYTAEELERRDAFIREVGRLFLEGRA
ncbi:hypothetical protein DAETH_15550 [Deinococcus aetherius]|uniref:Transglutaminase-like domain-containing protein n=1 Tax=Deinococcus aetherius TaxID=200252 RepID=A0ABM8ACS9_9DEIO|nr:hypothetical protein [Deinococcus aetherius]BDP41586.1 hypothetical protein DAETH_15550 [Deinococcus aetherius]